MSDNKICTQCGRKIFNSCPEPTCKAYWQDYWEKRADNKLSDYQSKVEELKKKRLIN
ncbi:MAG: hypothetical protein GBAus27B_000295 [Mycoplasmataceae bacterium]|nr:MAG: hypothetical protein GBAus27B_000295 [Mycoplasmataceae bacterium]